MPDYPAGQERLLRQLVGTFRCEVCRCRFDGDHVRIAARHEQLWIISVRCRRCRHQQVFWVARNSDEDEAAITDLTDEEELRFAAMTPVTGDDILDVHQFLEAFDGDFKRLFPG
jgi:hypothetical protein